MLNGPSAHPIKCIQHKNTVIAKSILYSLTFG